jgi:hypothetical protein
VIRVTLERRRKPETSGSRPARRLTFVARVWPQAPDMTQTPRPEDRPERIGAEGTEPMGGATRSGEARKRDLEEELDAALACTFPASDPIGCLGTELNCPKPVD